MYSIKKHEVMSYFQVSREPREGLLTYLNVDACACGV